MMYFFTIVSSVHLSYMNNIIILLFVVFCLHTDYYPVTDSKHTHTDNIHIMYNSHKEIECLTTS